MRWCLACRYNSHCKLSSAGYKNVIVLILNLRENVCTTQAMTLCCETNDGRTQTYTHMKPICTSSWYTTLTLLRHIGTTLKPVVSKFTISCNKTDGTAVFTGFQQSWGWYMTHHYNVAVPRFHNKVTSHETATTIQFICWILKFKLVEDPDMNAIGTENKTLLFLSTWKQVYKTEIFAGGTLIYCRCIKSFRRQWWMSLTGLQIFVMTYIQDWF